MAGNPNLELLEQAAAHLGELLDEVAFLGGCSIGLLITDPAAPAIRATKDVDVITEIGSHQEYHRLAARLRAQGFQEDTTEGAPVCRFRGHGIVLDVMPTDERILGFSNRWYKEALAHTFTHELPSGRTIRLVSAPYILATKLEAFRGRAEGDLWSPDMEDIVALVDGRPELVDEMLSTPTGLKAYLATTLAELLGDGDFQDALPGHLPGDAASQARLPMVMDRFRQIAKG